MTDDKIVSFADRKRERRAKIPAKERAITSGSVRSIAARAAMLLASDKIDIATATHIAELTQEALAVLSEGKLGDETAAELHDVEIVLTRADRA